MKSLLVATFVDFWSGGSGHRSRISALLDYLQRRVEITVFYAGCLSDRDRAFVRQRFPFLTMEGACPIGGLHGPGSSGALTYGEYVAAFGDFVRDKSFDFVLVEYIELSAVLEYLPASTVTLLDTHDLVAQRIGSFQKAGVPYDGIELSFEDELDLFHCYDHILFIQQNELESVAPWMDRDRLVLAPHPVMARRSPSRVRVRDIGFVASPYAPNVDALRWFLGRVWGSLSDRFDGNLHVYGNIRQAFSGCPVPGVQWHGFVADLEEVYRDCDVIINPVQCGAGLKIKNVEALAHGLPLVTTSHGAAGMEDGAGNCFLVADGAEEFAAAIALLIGDDRFRRALAEKAFTYAREHFSAERCFGGLDPIFI
jgi:glycosyltransferase involved in cell wall biosynthesis